MQIVCGQHLKDKFKLVLLIFTCTRVGAVGGNVKNRRKRFSNELTIVIERIKTTSMNHILNLSMIHHY